MRAFHLPKRACAVILALMMTLTLAPLVFAAETQIYYGDFEKDSLLQQNGDSANAASTKFAAAGNSSLGVTITGSNDYDGVALKNATLGTPMVPGGVYKLTAKALSEANATLGVRVETKDANGTDTYGKVGQTKAALKAGEWTDITLEFTVPADHRSVSAIVFHNTEKLKDFTFYLDEVKLVALDVPQGGTSPAGERELIQISRFNFANKAEYENVIKPVEPKVCTLDLATNLGHGDSTSLKLTHVSGQLYTSNLNAARYTINPPLPAGTEYKITAWFYAPSAGNEGKGTIGGPNFVVNGEYGGDLGVTKFPAAPGALPLDQWKSIDVTIPAQSDTISLLDFRLYSGNNFETQPEVWYLDDITISRVGETVKVEAPPVWNLSLPSLKDTYKDYFLFGNIIGRGTVSVETSAETTAMFNHHYNVVTAENTMKPVYMSPERGKYNFSGADELIAWAQKNNQKIHGHTLVWHSQSAPWLTNADDKKPLTRSQAKANLEDYITNVAGRYAGQLISWDVVNEAMADGVSAGGGWKSGLRKDSPWYIAYANGAGAGESGADYIYDAFVLTRLADPTATLYYNDYNETDAGKRDCIALMVEDLNKQWKNDSRNTDPDRLLIEGIGMQAHFWVGQTQNIENEEAAIKRFIQAGVKISVSELDAPYGTYSNQHAEPLTKEQEMIQARLYAGLFELYRKYADYIERVTIWGKTDPQNWRGKGSPVLFDGRFNAKQSFYAIINTDTDLENPFNDVPYSEWYWTHVAYVNENKLMTGTNTKLALFSPNERISWSQFLNILYRMDGQTGVTTGADWNKASDAWAVSNGIAKAGFSSGEFLKRQDMAIIIEKYVKYANKALKSGAAHVYADDSSISSEAKTAVSMLYNAGIITGKSGNIFDPNNFTDRSEVSKIVHLLDEAFKS